MAFDLMISEAGDLIVSAAKDIQGLSGTYLIDQQIKIRLKLARGSWLYDPTLGSDLHSLMGKNFDSVEAQIEAYARVALEDIEEIVITQVQVGNVRGVATVLVGYRVKIGETIAEEENVVNIGLGAPGGGS